MDWLKLLAFLGGSGEILVHPPSESFPENVILENSIGHFFPTSAALQLRTVKGA